MITVTQINNDVLSVLSKAEADNNIIRLTCGQLDRKMYLEVNKILEAMGGQWNRKEKGHVFDDDPADFLDNVVLTGEIEIPSKNGYFPTPKLVVKRLIELAEIEPGMSVLEPSAGQGAIAEELAKLDIDLRVAEILPQNAQILVEKGFSLVTHDFLTLMKCDGLYDRVVMNPPFEKQQDIDHVMHAYSLLKPDGRLVSVMSAGVKFRDNNKTKDFRDMVDAGGYMEDLPDGAFRESGTMVRAVIVVLD